MKISFNSEFIIAGVICSMLGFGAAGADYAQPGNYPGYQPGYQANYYASNNYPGYYANYAATASAAYAQPATGTTTDTAADSGEKTDDAVDMGESLRTAREACAGISEAMTEMKKKAGINTALSGVSAGTSAVGLGAGIAEVVVSAKSEKEQDDLDSQHKEAKNNEERQEIIEKKRDKVADNLNGVKVAETVRTGALAVSAATGAAGAVMAMKNRVGQDLDTAVADCIAAVDKLSNDRLRARAENTATDEQLAMAEKIVTECADWKNVDLSKIDKDAKIAAITGGSGAGLALVGAGTSAGEQVMLKKAQQGATVNAKTFGALTLTADVTAAAGAAASGVATAFNALQIKAIKKAVAAADKCEAALVFNPSAPAAEATDATAAQ